MNLLNGIHSRHCCLLFLLAFLATSCGKPERPNIVVIVAESLYWAGLSCEMHPELKASANQSIQTPNLAKLANEGLRFSAAYASSPIASIGIASIENGKSAAELNMEAETIHTPIGDWLKSSGYQIGFDILDLDQSPQPFYRQIIYPAMSTAALDQKVGEVLAQIDAAGVAGSTYIIFTAGSGKIGPGDSPLPLLAGGSADSLLEASIRVPMIVRGPGISSNSWSEQRVVGFDLLPTLCHLARVDEEPLFTELQGGSFVHLLAGETSTVERPNEALVFHLPGKQAAIMMGDHKLIRNEADDSIQLFDLHKDIGEKDEISKQVPEFSKRMLKRMDGYLRQTAQ